jgi:hypothetical protein
VKRPALAPGHLSWGRVDRGTVAFGAGVVGICLAVGAGVSLVLPEEPNGKAVLIGAFVACAFAALGPIFILGRGAAREPIVYYPIIAFVDLAGGALAWLGKPESPMSLARADVTKALLLVAAGFVALWAGWFATRGRRSTHPRAPLSPSELPSRRLTIGLASLGLVALVTLVATGSFGYVANFNSGGSLGPWTAWVVATQSALDAALAFAAFRVFGTLHRSRARPDLYLLIGLLILEFGIGLISGTKMFIVPRLLVVTFIYGLFHDRLPLKWMFAAVVALSLTFPIVQQYRMLRLESASGASIPTWFTFGSNSLSTTTAQARAGAMAARLDCEDDVRLAGKNLVLPSSHATYTASAFVYIPSSWNGGRLYLSDDGTFADATVASRTFSDMALRDQWQQVTFVFRAASDLSGLLLLHTESLPISGSTVYLDLVEIGNDRGGLATKDMSFETSGSHGVEPNAVELAFKGVSRTMFHPRESAALAFDTLGRRTRQIENLAVIVRDTPSVWPYTHGEELPRALAVAVVPRVLWPGKPQMDSATTYSRLYLKQPASIRSRTGPSHFGDLYRNFGLFGIILGMALFGAVFARLGRSTERAGIRALFIIAFILTVLTRVEDPLGNTIIVFVHVMVPILLVGLLLPRSHSKGADTRA